MRELSDLFESLYSHFIMRDVLAKVIPGLIAVLSLLALIAPHSLRILPAHLRELDLLTAVFVYGVSFMSGMLVQYLVSLAPFIRIHVWNEGKRQSTQDKSLAKAVEFHKVAAHDPALLRQRERFAVLKEMAANFAGSLLLALLALVRTGVFTHKGLRPPALFAVAFLVAVIIALVFQNRLHAREQQTWEQETISQYSKPGSPARKVAG